MTRGFQGLGVVLVLLTTNARAGQEVRVFTASDLVAKTRFSVQEGGRLKVSIWRSTTQSWSARLDGDRLIVRLEDVDEDLNGSGRAAWEQVGVVALEPLREYQLGYEIEEEGDYPEPLPVVVVLAYEGFDPESVLAWVRGRVGTIDAEPDARRESVRTNQEGVEFEPPESLDAWRTRASALREQLMVTLGQWPELPRSPVRASVSGILERDGYVIEKVTLETLPGLFLSGNLYRPAQMVGRLPMVLSPHGHWAEGRLNSEVQHRCIGFAKLGCLVFMYDMVGYNESKEFGHTFRSDRLRRWGLSLAALQTWNSRRVLDWVLSRPDVDPRRIACTGESGGGTQTFLLTAIDQRIRAAAPVVMVSEGFQGGCECENPPGLRWGTDNVEIAALAAPRPLKLVGATGDWTSNTTAHILPVLRGVYGLYGVPDRVSADVFTAPHNYNQTSRNAVYAFLGGWLLGLDDPSRTTEGPQTTEDGSALLTIDAEHPLPEPRSSPSELEAFLVAQRDEAIQRMRPSMFPAEWEAAREHLARIHRVRLGLRSLAPGEVVYRELRRADRDGLWVGHGQVERGEPADSVPVVWVEKPGARRAVILASPRGKAALVGPDGRLASLAQALVDRGFRVVAFDPLYVGDAFEPTGRALRRSETDHYETYNPSLAVDRIRDLETVAAWASGWSGDLGVDLVAWGSMGPLVLLALPGLEGLGRAAVDLEGFDYGDGSGAVPLELDLAGVLQFGGLPVAAALAAPRPLRIIRPSEGFERSWAVNAYALAGAADQVMIDQRALDVDSLVRWLDQGG
ncbi:MAG: acetylxylan esterase [Isosphaeraceae bacterium]|jgi:dienelactone hydrolase|nr:MAG: acetylxylan esterase [Isosphaeraceae bacterium]